MEVVALCWWKQCQVLPAAPSVGVCPGTATIREISVDLGVFPCYRH